MTVTVKQTLSQCWQHGNTPVPAEIVQLQGKLAAPTPRLVKRQQQSKFQQPMLHPVYGLRSATHTHLHHKHHQGLVKTLQHN
jgi:hypothetical protein